MVTIIALEFSSNRRPSELYEGGINRFLFLPFVDLLRERCDCLDMTELLRRSDGQAALPTDYRLRHQEDAHAIDDQDGDDEEYYDEQEGEVRNEDDALLPSSRGTVAAATCLEVKFQEVTCLAAPSMVVAVALSSSQERRRPTTRSTTGALTPFQRGLPSFP